MEGLLLGVKAGRSERWMASVAFWLGRQDLYSAQAFWQALGAKIVSELPAAEQASIKTQMSKQEDAAFDAVGEEWPAIPSSVQQILDGWVPEAPDANVDLDQLRIDASAFVDREAEKFRLKFITPGYGQTMAYQQKLAEARSKIANGSIADADIPHIVAEAEATGMTKAEKAEEIVNMFEQWQQISARIEGLRLAAKKEIADAEDAPAIRAAQAVNWSAAAA
jgi:hypothetical protein